MKIETGRVEMEAKEAKMKEEARANSIAGHAMMNKDLSTLAGAMQATDLTTMLSGPEEYIVFAPSNQAFEKLPQKKRDELTMPENKKMFSEVLTYYVAPGVITSDKTADALMVLVKRHKLF